MTDFPKSVIQRLALLVVSLCVLAGCGKSPESPATGDVSDGEREVSAAEAAATSERLETIFPEGDSASANAAPAKLVLSWAEVIDRAKDDPEAEPWLDALRKQAHAIMVTKPVMKRPTTFAEYGRGRAVLAGGEPAFRQIARSTPNEVLWQVVRTQLDREMIASLADEMFILCAVYRLDGDDAVRRRIVYQLYEFLEWNPLIRTPSLTELRTAGIDGDLAQTTTSGDGIQIIHNCFTLLPPDVLVGELREEMERMLTREGITIRELLDLVGSGDEAISLNAPAEEAITWSGPIQGAILSGIHLGKNWSGGAYEKAVLTLLAILNDLQASNRPLRLPTDAAFIRSTLLTARITALDGDFRLRNHPFLKTISLALHQHASAPDGVIMRGDWSTSPMPPANLVDSLLTEVALTTNDPVARWMITNILPESSTVSTLALRYLPAVTSDAIPAAFFLDSMSQTFSWRDAWENNCAFMLAYGSPDAGIDHGDVCHVSLTVDGRPVFIETGSPQRLRPEIPFGEAEAHNTMFIDDEPPAAGRVPITERRLTANEVNLRINGSIGFESLNHWYRDIFFNEQEIRIVDDLTFKLGERRAIKFRWHLGTDEDVTIEYTRRWLVSWSEFQLEFQTTSPIEIIPGKAVHFDPMTGEEQSHTVLDVIVTEKKPTYKSMLRVFPQVHEAPVENAEPDTETRESPTEG